MADDSLGRALCWVAIAPDSNKVKRTFSSSQSSPSSGKSDFRRFGGGRIIKRSGSRLAAAAAANETAPRG